MKTVILFTVTVVLSLSNLICTTIFYFKVDTHQSNRKRSMSFDEVECETGWMTYKNKLCIKSFPNLRTYEEAKEFCSAQGNDIYQSTLVMAKGKEIQNFLTNYTLDLEENAWLGGLYNRSSELKWNDDETVTFTNWEPGYPSNTLGTENCIELRPSRGEQSSKTGGNWANVDCGKRNHVICQRALTWTVEEAVGEISKIRKELRASAENIQETRTDQQTTNIELRRVKADLQDTKTQLWRTNSNLKEVGSRIVPVGSIYIEYYNQPSPRSLWPNFVWADISSSYAGLFFRVFGGGSSSWGTTQSECSPRINEMKCHRKPAMSVHERYRSPLTIPSNGWSDIGDVGEYWHGKELNFEGIQFHTSGCEVRPRNQPIRIWKRTD